VAQNIDKLDVAVVLDRSGSMEFDPVCYGCWERDDEKLQEPNVSGDPLRWADYFTYRYNGNYYPIGYNEATFSQGGFAHTRINGDSGVCEYNPRDAEDLVYVDIDEDNTRSQYIVMEAELYSDNNTTPELALPEQPQGYWAMQRGEGRYDNTDPLTPPYFGWNNDQAGELRSTSIDLVQGTNVVRGAHMAHHPSMEDVDGVTYGRFYTLAEARADEAPRLSYDFRFRSEPGLSWVEGDYAYIWLRVHAGRGMHVQRLTYVNDNDPGRDNKLYATAIKEWDDGDPNTPMLMDDIYFNPNDATPAIEVPNIPEDNGLGWTWVRMPNPITINLDHYYRLYVYAGSPGISIDQIVVTDDVDSLPDQFYASVENMPQATAGSAYGVACDVCNPIYGAVVDDVSVCTDYFAPEGETLNNLLHPLFEEWENPMRPSKEAIKSFIKRLDPEKDQVGLVSYNGENNATRTELQCAEWAKTGTVCADPAISYTLVLKELEDVRAFGKTNTAAGMKDGLGLLGISLPRDAGSDYPNVVGNGHCDGDDCARGAAAQRIMILMTDGVPTANPGGNCTNGDAPNEAAMAEGAIDNANHRCPLWFAQQASNRGITLYVIGLGQGINRPYLQQLAKTGGGMAYFSSSETDLNLIFSEILNNIFVRLVK